MTGTHWPALDGVLAALGTAPSRTGSVVVTIYGDAILPRGGSLALADLLVLMRRLGAPDGVVRTAISRLARDGMLQGRRTGRRSAYRLTARGQAECLAAIPQIYGAANAGWDGRLRLAFPEPGANRVTLDQAGFALLAPGILMSPGPAPDDTPYLEATGSGEIMQHLATRAWPLARLGEHYDDFLQLFAPLLPIQPAAPLDAMAARTVLIHAWRRIALRDPHLPAALLPPNWPGLPARTLCTTLYAALVTGSETWLDHVSDGASTLPPAPNPSARFG